MSPFAHQCLDAVLVTVGGILVLAFLIMSVVIWVH